MSKAIAHDHFDRAIRTNDVITYPVRKGSSMWLESAKVNGVADNGGLSITKTNGRRTVLLNTDMALLAPKAARSEVNAEIRANS